MFTFKIDVSIDLEILWLALTLSDCPNGFSAALSRQSRYLQGLKAVFVYIQDRGFNGVADNTIKL